MKNSKIVILIFLSSLYAASLQAGALLFSEAYKLALENANEIKASVYSSESDKEKITQEKSQLYPQVNLSAYYKKTEYVVNPSENKIEQGLINYTVSLKQSVYNPEVYSRIDTQEARSEYSITRVELEKEELAKNVFNAYLDILKSKNKIELLKSYLEYNKYKLQELTKRYDMHLSNKMDLLQIKVNYNSAQIDLNKEEKLFKVYDLKLKQFIGDAEYEFPTIELDKPILEMIASMRERVLSVDESSVNLKVKQAQIALKISKGDISNAKSGHLPKVNLDASYAKYDTDTPTTDSPYNNIKSVMLTLNIPIYSGGYVSSKVASSQLMYKAANEDLISTKKQVKVAYNESLAIFEASTESVSMYKEAVESAELYVEAITQGYEHGLKSIIDLSDAKNKLYEVKYKYIENIYEMVDSYMGLLIITDNFEDIELLDKLVK